MNGTKIFIELFYKEFHFLFWWKEKHSNESEKLASDFMLGKVGQNSVIFYWACAKSKISPPF